MPSDLTIFVAQNLLYIDAVLAVAVIVYLLYRKPSDFIVRWVVTILIALVLGYIVAQIGAAVYNDPRPFTQDHVKPLISHANDNGFPSDHALLAAAIVAAVLLVSPVWALPFALIGFLVDWARVGAGIHHVVDVLGSSVILAAALIVGYVISPFIARWITPLFARTGWPARWDARQGVETDSSLP